ncbi:MAG: stage III sporulation protein AB [Lachnospiraceae bacterium]|nr:stage III sporulation protein AB [Lachnospiraceae bacterium]
MKWLGMCMVLVGCFSIGVWYSLMYARRIKNLLACKKAILIIRGEISYGRSPLPQALLQASGRVSGSIRTFLEDVCEKMEQGGARLDSIWQTALEEQIGSWEMGREECMELKELGETLGYLDVEMQLQTIQLYLERLEGSIRELEREKSSRIRLYPILGTMCGALICIILI